MRKTKFEKLRTWLHVHSHGFNFTQLGKAMRAPYPSTYYTYLNLLRNAGIVKKTSRGQYRVTSTTRLWGTTLQDLTNRVQVKALRRKLEDTDRRYWKLVREHQQLSARSRDGGIH